MAFTPFSLKIRDKLVEFNRPVVMGILNVTPDSFYAPSRKSSYIDICRRVEKFISEGADIIDIGAYSSRPGAIDVNSAEESRRLSTGLSALRDVSSDVIVSVDTFRADVAKLAVESYGADIVNDISGGDLDGDMCKTVADLKVPYILMHMRGTPKDMQSLTDYKSVTAEVIDALSKKLRDMRLMGIADIIVDPGFGFGKTLEQNYELIRNFPAIVSALEAPVLVGVSRKSMIYNALGITPEDALVGTIALNTLALEKGASIIRVHDVREAVQAVKIFQTTYNL